jgi:hypothetical protein
VFNDRLRRRATGSSPVASRRPARATVIDNRGEQPCSPTGPFVESKEYLAGFWIIEAPTSTWRSSSPPRVEACNRKVEVRPFL